MTDQDVNLAFSDTYCKGNFERTEIPYLVPLSKGCNYSNISFSLGHKISVHKFEIYSRQTHNSHPSINANDLQIQAKSSVMTN